MKSLPDFDMYKGLVIFNPAVAGWSRGEGGQKMLKGIEKVKNFF